MHRDADVLRTGIASPSARGQGAIMGTFLRSFRWGQSAMDRVRDARAWAAEPGDGPLTATWTHLRDLRSGQGRGAPPQLHRAGLSPADGRRHRDLLARLREGRANTARGSAHFLLDGGTGALRRGQGTTNGAGRQRLLPTPLSPTAVMDVRFSITVRQRQSLHNLIEAIPEEDWTPIPYWMDGTADVAESSYTPFQSEPDAAPVRLIVRRVQPTTGSQLALFATYSYHGCITDRRGRPWNWKPTIAATPRSRTPSETSSTASD